MADALSGLTEVAGTIETIVAAEVQMVLNSQAQLPGTVLDYSSMVGPGMDTLKIPKFGKFTVGTKSENTSVEAQTNAFSTDDLALSRHKVIQFLLEDIANLQSKVAVTQAYVSQAAIDLANEMDQAILDGLEAGVSTSAPDHKRAYAGSTIAAADILLARQLLNEQNVPLADRFLVVSPAEEAAILAISNFVKANEIGTDAVVRNGEIGKLYGFTVIVSSKAEDAKSMAYHKSAFAFARQLAPRIQSFNDVANLAMRWSIDHLYGVKQLDAGKRQVLLGTA